MDDILSGIVGTVPVSSNEECLEKTGSLCVGRVGVGVGWRPEGQELSSIRTWSKVSIHLGDFLFESLRSMSLSRSLYLSVSPAA